MSNLLAQPTTPVIELDLYDMTRAFEVPSDLLARLREQLDEPTLVMPPPTFRPPPEERPSERLPPRRPRAHVFLAVLLGLVVSGGEVFAAGTFYRVVIKLSHPS